MKGINKVIAVGTFGSDPTTKYLPSGGAVTNFSIAVNESWKDKSTGRSRSAPVAANCDLQQAGRDRGRVPAQGQQGLHVEGSIRTRKWQDKEGRDQYTTEIVAGEMQMLDGKRDADAAPQQELRHAARAGGSCDG